VVISLSFFLGHDDDSYTKDYLHVFMPVFLGIKIFSRMLGTLVCGSICLIPFALLDIGLNRGRVLGFRIAAVAVICVLIFSALSNSSFDFDEFHYVEMLNIDEKQYFILEREIFFDDGSYSEWLFYECSQSWCDLVYAGMDKVTMIYEPETKTLILRGGYRDEVLYTHPVP
jgi:hypothetical protein